MNRFVLYIKVTLVCVSLPTLPDLSHSFVQVLGVFVYMSFCNRVSRP